MMFSAKTIVVTGAASGIGAACAAKLKTLGATVISMDRADPEHSDWHQSIQYDQGNPLSIDAAVKQLPKNIDALLNIAGVAPSERFTAEDVLRINFFGVRYLIDTVLPKLKSSGSIVNMSSGTGAGWASNLDNIRQFLEIDNVADIGRFVSDKGINNSGTDNLAAYPFSKQLVNVMTMKMAFALKQRGCRINAIAPAAVSTPIVDDFLESFGEEASKRLSSFGAATPAAVADATLFMVSENSRWINGAILPVDAGAVATGTISKAGL